MGENDGIVIFRTLSCETLVGKVAYRPSPNNLPRIAAPESPTAWPGHANRHLHARTRMARLPLSIRSSPLCEQETTRPTHITVIHPSLYRARSAKLETIP